MYSDVLFSDHDFSFLTFTGMGMWTVVCGMDADGMVAAGTEWGWDDVETVIAGIGDMDHQFQLLLFDA